MKSRKSPFERKNGLASHVGQPIDSIALNGRTSLARSLAVHART